MATDKKCEGPQDPVTMKEAAEIAGVTRQAVYHAIQRGHLRAWRGKGQQCRGRGNRLYVERAAIATGLPGGLGMPTEWEEVIPTKVTPPNSTREGG